ncbi:MAG: hypothetical protein V2I25_06565 [Woeseiaceae bacterium]|nr:hypothetical protein [Woeseiaceae bacterium]
MNDRADGLRIAMWSGPRNVSTAMMRAWENRADTVVCDEPFYACYLAATGIEHPLGDAVIAAGETDWRRVVDAMTGPIPGGKPIFYQKQMTHHFLPEIDRSWLDRVTHCFLIRHPRDVLLSYARMRDTATSEDIGFPQQVEIFEHVFAAAGAAPVVIDSADLLKDPRAILETVCRRLGIEFSDRMLSWPKGPRDSDGVWAPHWYGSVYASTGFAPYQPRTETLPVELEGVLEECLPLYEQLYEHRITADPG